ncbi:hypothetical protein RJ639_002262 [Escallonia herrerae]|uniref:Uncharacterized protein n=1 Tax=Escallonia herrerae TaxID=1293975 RepID=A0AA89BFK5_9ASTE|nr:hypothetical protein RJ639_002262 [Escallonia herrerae]
MAPNKEEIVGRVLLPVVNIERRLDDKQVASRWHNLDTHFSNPNELKSVVRFASRIHLHASVDGGYHVLDKATMYSSDVRPTVKQLWKPHIGVLQMGILGASILMPVEMKEGKGVQLMPTVLLKAAVTALFGRFHAKEYPAYDKEVFPYNMGYCQRGSNVMYDDSMNLRNILWLAPLPNKSTQAWLAPGVLVVLDARPGGIIYTDLISDYVDYARTLYEDDFGDIVADVNYLNVGGAKPDFQIFIC